MVTDNTIEKRNFADTLILVIAIFVFFGTWIEVAINTGLIGVVLGWIPGLVLSYIVILFTESK